MNVFNLYFHIEYVDAMGNDIKNDNIYELSEILWMIKKKPYTILWVEDEKMKALKIN